MKHIEQSNVAGESWNRSLDILTAKIDVPVARRDATSLSCFPRIDVESEDRLPATAFTQVKREQTKPAADIQDRLVRATKQFASDGINGITAQFAPHITTEPALWKLDCDAGASRLMFAEIVSPVFHLLRIIALPD
jgi:hypothetical protein